MNHEIGHDNWTITPTDMGQKETCPRCHRLRVCGTFEDGCRACQSCAQKAHGMGDLPSDHMDQEKSQQDWVFLKIKEIWGKDKVKTGYNWIAAKFGPHWAKSGDKNIEEILFCLDSKRDQIECPLHKRIHDAKP